MTNLFTGVNRLRGHTAKNIDFTRYHFHVIWVDTASDTTQVVDMQIFWNRPMNCFISKSMGTYDYATRFDLISSITSTRTPTNPKPTS